MSSKGKELIQCCGNNDIKRVRNILSSNPDSDVLNYRNNGGNTPLIQATTLNTALSSDKMVKLLLDAGADIEIKNKYGVTALMSAARKGYAIVVQTLLDAGADFLVTCENGERALDKASDRETKRILQAKHDDLDARNRAALIEEISIKLLDSIIGNEIDVVNALISEYKEEYSEFLEFQSCEARHENKVALCHAVNIQNLQAVQTLLSAGARPDTVHESSTTAMTPLMMNCSVPHKPSYPTTTYSRQVEGLRHSITEALVEAGASLTRTDRVMQTALVKAVLNFHDNDIVVMFDKYPDAKSNGINIQDKWGNTALILAAKVQNIGAVRLLIENKADLNTQQETGMTALMWACWNGNADCIQALLSAGAYTDLQSECGRTAVFWAVEKGHSNAVRLMLEQRADPNIPHPMSGSTPALVAARKNDLDTIDKLIEGGARLNDRNEEGMTPLMWAAYASHDNMVEKLMKNGAIPKLKNRAGKSALQLAKKPSTKAVVKENTMKITVEREIKS